MKSNDSAGTSASPVLLMLAERFSPDLGGVSRSASRTAAAISRLGWQVHVVAWTKSLPPGAVDDAVTEDGVTVHRVGLFSNWDYSMQHTMNVLEWLHEKFVFDAVWGHYLFPAGYLAVVFARTMGLQSTVSARGNDVDRLMFPPGDFARLIWTLEKANTVSCVSEDLARKVKVLLEDEIEIAVLPNVVDATVFVSGEVLQSSLRIALGIQPEDAVLGFCGELRHKKGLPFILSALVQVCQDRKACLLVIGEIRPREQAHLSAFAAQHPEVADRILVTGHLVDAQGVAEHLNLCDVVLQPSVWDGLPNSVLEAMACSRIVIASDAGGIPEAVDHGVNGFVIPKATLNNLGTAVIEVLNLPDHKRAAIQDAARETVLRKFQAQGEADRLQLLLSGLVSGCDRSVS
jgi:glycosyltransferase involved in cell wall biosynthesis